MSSLEADFRISNTGYVFCLLVLTFLILSKKFECKNKIKKKSGFLTQTVTIGPHNNITLELYSYYTIIT